VRSACEEWGPVSSVEPEGQEGAGPSDSPPKAILDQHWEQRSVEFTLDS